MTKTDKRLVLDNENFFLELRAKLAEGHRVTLQASGWSMLPYIWDARDTLTLTPLRPDSIRLGRIVLAQLGDRRYIVHRIVDIKEDRITLRGDGNPYQTECCHREQVLAELYSICRDGKQVTQSSPLSWVMRHLWPRNGFLRRACLYCYRRLFVYPRVGRPAPRRAKPKVEA